MKTRAFVRVFILKVTIQNHSHLHSQNRTILVLCLQKYI